MLRGSDGVALDSTAHPSSPKQEKYISEYAASRRAFRLLRSHLTRKQRNQLKRSRSIDVVGSHSGDVYRIRCHDNSRYDAAIANIIHQRTKKVYCLHLETDDFFDDLPDADHYLAQKLIIETNERSFLRKARRCY